MRTPSIDPRALSRRRPVGAFVALIAAGALFACGDGGPARGTSPPAPADATADLEAIARLRAEYVAAHNAGDVQRLMNLWADDGVMMPIDEPALVGKQAIAAHVQSFMDQSPAQIELEPDETVAAGEWAFERGHAAITLPATGGGEALHQNLKYLAIFRKQPDGAWKLARYIYNLDDSPAEPQVTQPS